MRKKTLKINTFLRFGSHHNYFFNLWKSKVFFKILLHNININNILQNSVIAACHLLLSSLFVFVRFLSLLRKMLKAYGLIMSKHSFTNNMTILIYGVKNISFPLFL